MEKYGQPSNAIIENLRNEEAHLMQQIQKQMCESEKTAEVSRALNQLNDRLHQVRIAIYDHDIKE